MSASDALNGQQFRIDHEQLPAGGGAARAYEGSSNTQKWLGTLHYSASSVDGAHHVDNVNVDSSARRRGVASALYGKVHSDTGAPFVHAPSEMSTAGKKTVAALAARNPEAHKRLAHTSTGNATARKW